MAPVPVPIVKNKRVTVDIRIVESARRVCIAQVRQHGSVGQGKDSGWNTLEYMLRTTQLLQGVQCNEGRPTELLWAFACKLGALLGQRPLHLGLATGLDARVTLVHACGKCSHRARYCKQHTLNSSSNGNRSSSAYLITRMYDGSSSMEVLNCRSCTQHRSVRLKQELKPVCFEAELEAASKATSIPHWITLTVDFGSNPRRLPIAASQPSPSEATAVSTRANCTRVLPAVAAESTLRLCSKAPTQVCPEMSTNTQHRPGKKDLKI